MEHMKWLEATTGGDSAREIGRHADVSFRTVSNQINRQQFSAEVVIKIAEGYGKSPVRALVDTGYLDEQWAKTVDPETAIWDLTEEQIADHVLERMKLPGQHQSFHTPVADLDAKREENTPDKTSPDQQDGAETTHSVRGDDDDDGTVRPFDWAPGTYAADSTINEQEAREAEGADPID